MLVKDSGVAEDKTYDLIVKGIQAAPRARGKKNMKLLAYIMTKAKL